MLTATTCLATAEGLKISDIMVTCYSHRKRDRAIARHINASYKTQKRERDGAFMQTIYKHYSLNFSKQIVLTKINSHILFLPRCSELDF